MGRNVPDGEAQPGSEAEDELSEEEATAVSVYEETIRNPEYDSALSSLNPRHGNGMEVPSSDAQAFLASQVEILDRLRVEDEREKSAKDKKKGSAVYISQDDASGIVEEHIGPVQFNMGGIQVNADEMVKRLQVSTLSLCIQSSFISFPAAFELFSFIFFHSPYNIVQVIEQLNSG
jgi:dynein light intermediate chain 1